MTRWAVVPPEAWATDLHRPAGVEQLQSFRPPRSGPAAGPADDDEGPVCEPGASTGDNTMSALDVANAIADLLVDRVGEYSDQTSTAAVIRSEPDRWALPEMTVRHLGLLWDELQSGLVAELGAPLTRREALRDPADFVGRVVIAEPDEFDVAAPHDGWYALARAHRKEAGWDFTPDYDSGLWLGWWEPEQGFGEIATGMLVGFVILDRDSGDLVFAHVAKGHRRSGIGSRLVAHAREHHGLRSARGPFTNDGRAFAAAAGLL